MKKITLLLIIILTFVLRFYKLDTYPALNADEAAIGYNAYSLIQTGMDEHGNSWSIHFQSFNDYKPGLYFYLVLPFVKVLGLNEWAVRIPNALIGVATVFVLYLLINALEIKNSLKIKNYKLEISEIAMFLLAISPWHIHFSRGGWEVNTATFFIILGVYLFLKFVRVQKFSYLSFAFLAFAFSLYTYHSARIVAPLLGLSLLIIYRKDVFIKKNIKFLIANILLLITLIAPLVKDFVGTGALSRVQGVGILADLGPINRINEQRGEHGDVNTPFVKIIHNKFVNYGLRLLDNYTIHFSGEFLFMTGDSIERNKVPETGVLYLYDIIFLVVGFVYLFNTFTIKHKAYSIILVWLLIAPIASALTFQSPNALRSQNMVIPLTIISAIGVNRLLNKKLYTIYYILFTIFVAWCFSRYLYLYYNFMSKEFPFSSQYGVKELVSYVSENENKFNTIIVTDRYDQPYILFLFYTKYPPQEFQKNHTLTSRDNFGFSTVREFGKYRFESIQDFGETVNTYPKSLIVGTPKEIPKEANIVKRIYGTNGYNYFNIVAN